MLMVAYKNKIEENKLLVCPNTTYQNKRHLLEFFFFFKTNVLLNSFLDISKVS
jgi:hypothetical protein